MTGAVLSGGENSRLPYIKGLIKVDGKTIIERGIEALGGVCDRIVISANAPELYFPLGCPVIGDVVADKAPAVGIFSVLRATGADEVFVLACDMPFVAAGLVRRMVELYRERAESEDGAPEALVPVWRGLSEPLLAIYSARSAAVIESMLASGAKGLGGMLKAMKVLYMTEQDVRRFDPEGRSFTNINTMEELELISPAGGLR